MLRTLLARCQFTLILSLLAGGIAFADDPVFDKQIADIRILQDKRVQSEIHLTATQLAHLKGFSKTLDAEMLRLQKAYQAAVKKDKKAKQPTKEAQSVLFAFNTSCLNELSKSQMKRLRELTIQNAGLIAVFDTRVAAKLGITAGQVKVLRDRMNLNEKLSAQIQNTALEPLAKKYGNTKPSSKAEAEKRQKEVQAAMQKAAPKIRALENEFRALWSKTLTSAQKATFTALMGTPFKPK